MDTSVNDDPAISHLNIFAVELFLQYFVLIQLFTY